MTDWQSVAYSNAYNAAKNGQSLSTIISNQPDYAAASTSAYNAWKAKNSSSSSSSSSTATTTTAPTVATVSTESEPTTAETEAPTLELPTLDLTDEASTVKQTEKLLRSDSLLMQQAKATAQENGTASGQIHDSQQAGASMRAMTDVATELGATEAETAAGEQLSNWTSAATEATTNYENSYAERLALIGYEAETAQLMASLNTSLSQSMLSSYTSLLNNTDLDVDQGVTDKLLDIINAAQDNNNISLDMGFSY